MKDSQLENYRAQHKKYSEQLKNIFNGKEHHVKVKKITAQVNLNIVQKPKSNTFEISTPLIEYVFFSADPAQRVSSDVHTLLTNFKFSTHPEIQNLLIETNQAFIDDESTNFQPTKLDVSLDFYLVLIDDNIEKIVATPKFTVELDDHSYSIETADEMLIKTPSLIEYAASIPFADIHKDLQLLPISSDGLKKALNEYLVALLDDFNESARHYHDMHEFILATRPVADLFLLLEDAKKEIEENTFNQAEFMEKKINLIHQVLRIHLNIDILKHENQDYRRISLASILSIVIFFGSIAAACLIGSPWLLLGMTASILPIVVIGIIYHIYKNQRTSEALTEAEGLIQLIHPEKVELKPEFKAQANKNSFFSPTMLIKDGNKQNQRYDKFEMRTAPAA